VQCHYTTVSLQCGITIQWCHCTHIVVHVEFSAEELLPEVMDGLVAILEEEGPLVHTLTIQQCHYTVVSLYWGVTVGAHVVVHVELSTEELLAEVVDGLVAVLERKAPSWISRGTKPRSIR